MATPRAIGDAHLNGELSWDDAITELGHIFGSQSQASIYLASVREGRPFRVSLGDDGRWVMNAGARDVPIGVPGRTLPPGQLDPGPSPRTGPSSPTNIPRSFGPGAGGQQTAPPGTTFGDLFGQNAAVSQQFGGFLGNRFGHNTSGPVRNFTEGLFEPARNAFLGSVIQGQQPDNTSFGQFLGSEQNIGSILPNQRGAQDQIRELAAILQNGLGAGGNPQAEQFRQGLAASPSQQRDLAQDLLGRNLDPFAQFGFGVGFNRGFDRFLGQQDPGSSSFNFLQALAGAGFNPFNL